MDQKRPINLDLRSLKYPPMAIVSILHRISGIFLFLLFPFLLYFGSLSLQSNESYQELHALMVHPLGMLFSWVFLSALIFHLVAGIRHIIMDLGFGETLIAGRRSAIFVMVLAFILILGLGFWIWSPMLRA